MMLKRVLNTKEEEEKPLKRIKLEDNEDYFEKEGNFGAESLITDEMIRENEEMEKLNDQEENKYLELAKDNVEKHKDEFKISQLDALLSKAGMYSEFLSNNARLDEIAKSGTFNSSTQTLTMTIDFKQPKLLTGGELRPYQLAGVKWLVGLYENGLNGILADEMGLGKTIQVISLLAHIKATSEKGYPFLIVAPLSTLENWVREFKQFAPTVNVLLYHGSKEERRLKWANLKKYHKGSVFSKRFPVIVTSYELIIRDLSSFMHYSWKYIIVDEGHRLKNFNCLLVKRLKTLNSESRLLLSGTPLQNNLSELWSLLNFILPDVFDDLSLFESWFDFSAIYEKDRSSEIMAAEANNRIVSKLHEVLRPFVLRRLKSHVMKDLPAKVEIVVYAGMTLMQREFYRAIVKKEMASMLEAACNKKMPLRNIMVQLLKCCNHPFLIYEAESEGEEEIVENCGKLKLLDRLLSRLIKEGHKVLIFSQMTKLLDILEDYMILRGHKYCRIDGSVNLTSRQEQMDKFNKNESIPVFLLSTRAGGLGINLTSADTVIIYDSDWNPHSDSQAMDRCHRIGQLKKVMVYRLATAGSIEMRVLERAAAKKKLEKLVIHSGRLKGGPSAKEGDLNTTSNSNAGGLSSFSIEELNSLLKEDLDLKKDVEGVEYKGIPNDELDYILDRDTLHAKFLGNNNNNKEEEVGEIEKKGSKKEEVGLNGEEIAKKGVGYEIVSQEIQSILSTVE